MGDDMTFFLWSTSAVLNIIVSMIILCMLVSGESAYRAVGMKNWAGSAAKGSPIPSVIMAGIMLMFVIFAAYCIGAMGVFNPPAVYGVLIVVTAIYLSRVGVLIYDRFKKTPMSTFAIMSAYGALAIGGFQALALIFTLWL